MFKHTLIVTWMNNIIEVHSDVEKGLFWGNVRKEGYSLLVSKQVIVSSLGTHFGVPSLGTRIGVSSVGTQTTVFLTG